MNKSKIQTISKSKTIDYNSKIVEDFWLRLNNKSNNNENQNTNHIINFLDSIQESVVCIQTELLNNPEIIKSIFNASKRMNRIYILSNNKDDALEQLKGICLIRYGIMD